MKKLGLISALSLGLFLAGCTTKPITITSSSDMISMYNESNSMTCNLSYSSEGEEGNSVMYIKDGMISQETTTAIEGEKMTMYTLARDGKMYAWGDLYGEGIGMSLSYDIDIEEELQGFDDIEEDTVVTCVKGVKNNAAFDLPTNVEFSSMDDFMNIDYDLDEIDYEDEDIDIENLDETIDEEDTIEENVEDVIAE